MPPVPLPHLPKLAHRALHGGAVVRLALDAPPGNIIDGTMTASLRAAMEGLRADPHVKLILLEGSGPDFSFGVSVQEHRPDQVRDMLAGFHGLFRELAAHDVPLLALVHGRCLGGGLELASFCDWLFAVEGAEFGQPEIRLGVFAPLASVLLPWRMGGRAVDLLLTGRRVGAPEALTLGLADRVLPAGGAEEALACWIAEHLLPRSASSLRLARRAVREPLHERLLRDLPRLERLYLDDLMATRDAVEGIDAFLAKRPPSWSDD